MVGSFHESKLIRSFQVTDIGEACLACNGMSIENLIQRETPPFVLVRPRTTAINTLHRTPVMAQCLD